MDENLAYWSASFQRAGKWFSSSLALGTNVVADITDLVLSDMSCYHDRERRHCSYYKKKPHGGPITHSSTGSKPDSPVHPLFPNLFIACGLVCNSQTTVLLIYTGIRHNTYSDCFEPLSHFVSGFERLATRLKLLMVLSYLLSVFLRFSSRDTFRHFPR